MECHPINERLNRPYSFFFVAPGFFQRQRSTTAHERIRYHPRSPQRICSNLSSIGGDSNRLFDGRGTDAVRINDGDWRCSNFSVRSGTTELGTSELPIGNGTVRIVDRYRCRSNDPLLSNERTERAVYSKSVLFEMTDENLRCPSG